MADALDTTEATLCIERILAYQQAQGLADVALVRKYPALGSARTWSRLALQDWVSCPVDKWLPELRAVLDQIDGKPKESGNGVPIAFVGRHLAEAERCRQEGQPSLALSHLRSARRAIEDFQRKLRQPQPAAV